MLPESCCFIFSKVSSSSRYYLKHIILHSIYQSTHWLTLRIAWTTVSCICFSVHTHEDGHTCTVLSFTDLNLSVIFSIKSLPNTWQWVSIGLSRPATPTSEKLLITCSAARSPIQIQYKIIIRRTKYQLHEFLI